MKTSSDTEVVGRSGMGFLGRNKRQNSRNNIPKENSALGKIPEVQSALPQF